MGTGAAEVAVTAPLDGDDEEDDSAAAGPRLGPVVLICTQGSLRLGPRGRRLYEKKHTRRPVQDDDTIRKGTLMTAKAPPIYLRYTMHRKNTRRDFAFLSSVIYFFLLLLAVLHLYVGLLGSRVRVSFRGYTDRTNRHSLTEKKNLVLFFASPEFSFPVAVVSETLGVWGKLFTNFFFLCRFGLMLASGLSVAVGVLLPRMILRRNFSLNPHVLA